MELQLKKGHRIATEREFEHTCRFGKWPDIKLKIKNAILDSKNNNENSVERQDYVKVGHIIPMPTQIAPMILPGMPHSRPSTLEHTGLVIAKCEKL